MISLWLPMMRDGDALNVVVTVVISLLLLLLLLARLKMIVWPVSPSSRFGLNTSRGLPLLGSSSPVLHRGLPVRISETGHFSFSILGPFIVPALEVV